MKYFLFALFSCIMFISCESITGNGNVIRENRNVSDFNQIRTSGSVDVEVKSGDHYQVTVENDENLLPYVITEVNNGVLNIRYKDGYAMMNDHPKVFVTAPSLEKLVSSGSADITSDGVISSSKQIEISTSGSGDIKAEIDAPMVKATSSGSGDITLSGRTKDFECRISGSGDAKCDDLKSENAVIHVSGSSDVHVFASVNLKVNVTGSGDVYYKGHPSSPEIHITGSGTVKAQD
jgi:hypothetical protein